MSVQISIEERKVNIPEDVEVALHNKIIEIKGERGSLRQDFSHASVEIKHNKKCLEVYAMCPRKHERALVGTITSHINNMIKGVTRGFTYKLKIVYAHFPMSVKVDKLQKKAIVENFMGEKAPRKAHIIGDTNVEISGDDIIVNGIDLQEVSQTAANIAEATKVKKKDLRVFLDGIYVYDKK